MSIGRSPFGSFVRQEGGGEQAAEDERRPAERRLPPLPPPPPPPPPLPARAVRFRGQIVGHVDRDGVFVRRVHDRHVLRVPPSIALHVGVLAELARFGAIAVEFTMDDGSILTGPVSLYHGERSIAIDRAGYGQQRAVLLADFAQFHIRRATVQDLADFAAAVSR